MLGNVAKAKLSHPIAIIDTMEQELETASIRLMEKSLQSNYPIFKMLGARDSGEVTGQLQALATPVEDLRWIPSAHIRQLTAACMSSSRECTHCPPWMPSLLALA